MDPDSSSKIDLAMVSLMSLSDELISNTLSFISTRSDRLAVALTSKHLHGLILPYIFREAHINFQGPAIKGFPLAHKFITSIDINPSLAALVRSIGISAIGVPSTQITHKSYAEACDLLSKLCNLRWLQITRDFRGEFYSMLLSSAKLENLQTIWFGDNSLTMADIARYMSLPQMRAMTLLGIHTENGSCDFSSLRALDGRSGVLHLDIHEPHQPSTLPWEFLQTMLKWPRKLRKLRCPPTGNHSPPTPMSPVAIMEALQPVSHSIEELELIVEYNVWPDHDGSRLDLSQMKALRKLKCPAEMFFPPQASFLERVSFHELLPATIEEVKIYFFYDNCLVSTDGLEGKSIDSEVNWLFDLAINKAIFTPRLKLLCLQELKEESPPSDSEENYWSDDDDGEDKTLEWKPPPLISEALAEAHINLIAHLNRPVKCHVDRDDPYIPQLEWEEMESI